MIHNQELFPPQPHPQSSFPKKHPSSPLLQQHNKRMIHNQELLPPHPHPLLLHPFPQPVAAKSLIVYTSEIFIYSNILCDGQMVVTGNLKNDKIKIKDETMYKKEKNMKRILFMVLRCIVFVPFWYYQIKRYTNTEKYSEEEGFAFIHKIMGKICRAGRVEIDAKGMEQLPKENGYILFSNHQGLFDSLIFFETHERPFGIVIKKEMQNVILVKDIIRIVRGLYMDREDLRQSMRVIQQMSKEVKDGRNYLIFPEGTRSKTGNVPGEFKAGTFKSALKAKCPIVPVAIMNSFYPFDSGSIKPTKVYIRYLKPIEYVEYQSMKTKEIAAMVETKIREAIEQTRIEEGAAIL